MKPCTPEALEFFRKVNLTFAKIERNGFRVNVPYLKQAIASTNKEIKEIEEKLKEDEVYKKILRKFGSKTKLGSKDQLAWILFNEYGYKPKTFTEKGKAKLDKDYLESTCMDLDYVKNYLMMEKLRKAANTYLKNILDETDQYGFLHPFFHIHTTTTLRTSSSGPNFQNMPIRDPVVGKLIRNCFIPRDGHSLIEIDYGAMEFRIAACFWKDPEMVSYASDPTKDIHRDEAMSCYLLEKDQVSKNARYCNPGEAPVWMANFKFKPISEIKIGDELIGWYRPGGVEGLNTKKKGGKLSRKKLTKCTVIDIHKRKAPVVKITLESGAVIRCTPDHMWLNGNMQYNNSRGKNGISQKGGVFLNGDHYRSAKVGEYLSKIVTPVEPLTDPVLANKAGWLGGMMDGEGTWPFISQSQEKNPQVFKKLFKVVNDLNFEFTPYGKSGFGLRLRSTLNSATKFLNWCKPSKTKRIKNAIINRSSFNTKDKVIKIEPDGEEIVYGLTTTTGNYVVWGYASKNCAKNKFVFPILYGSSYAQCAKNLWLHMQTMDLRLATDNNVTVMKHLKSKGIKKLGLCDRKEPAKINTYEYVVKRAEENFNNRFKKFCEGKEIWWKEYERRGAFRLMTGFLIEGVFSRNFLMNTGIQGPASHCLDWSIVEIQKEFEKRKLKALIVAQIHDCVIFDCPDEEIQEVMTLAKEIMTEKIRQEWKWILTPLEIEADLVRDGETWHDKKPWIEKLGIWQPK